MAEATTLDQICNHLRLMGYDVSVDNEKNVIARHRDKLSMLVTLYDTGIQLKSATGCNDRAKSNRLGYLEFVNSLNENAIVGRFYVDEDTDFIIEAFYRGEYTPEGFNKFMEIWAYDWPKTDSLETRRYL